MPLVPDVYVELAAEKKKHCSNKDEIFCHVQELEHIASLTKITFFLFDFLASNNIFTM